MANKPDARDGLQPRVIPLASALLKAKTTNPADAIGEAANAVESFLARLAGRLGVDLSGASGISQKAERFRIGDYLPKKLTELSKYLAQVRNAADHGVDVDPDVGAVWHIQDSTAIEFVFVSCSFITTIVSRVKSRFVDSSRPSNSRLTRQLCFVSALTRSRLLNSNWPVFRPAWIH